MPSINFQRFFGPVGVDATGRRRFKKQHREAEMLVIDTNSNVSGHISILKEKGVGAVGRYFSSAASKRISKTEALEIAAAGMKIFTIFENDGDPDLNSDAGTSHAQQALQQAKIIGQPNDSTIYFALEHLPNGYTSADVPGIVNYIEQIRDVIGNRYRIGAYSDGVVLEALLQKKLIDCAWLSASRGFPGSKEFYAGKRWVLAQSPYIDMDWNGLSIDLNECKDDFGQFTLSSTPGPGQSVARLEVDVMAAGPAALEVVRGIEPDRAWAAPATSVPTGLSDRVPLPPLTTINMGLSSCRESTMLKKFGWPGELTKDCSDPVPGLAKLLTTASVGPINVTGQRYAMESLRQIFAEVRTTLPDVYAQVKTEGMLCVRGIRHNPTHYSNHSWGTAIDLYFGVGVIPQGLRLAHRGNLLLAPIFNKYGWYWGAGFSGDAVDSMHFEMSDETVLKMPEVDDLLATADDAVTGGVAPQAPPAPVSLAGRAMSPRPERAAIGWLQPILESAYAPLSPRAGEDVSKSTARPLNALGFAAGTILREDNPAIWRDRLAEYKRRKALALGRPQSASELASPVRPASGSADPKKWISLGPSVVLNGQTVGAQPVAGRVARLAIGRGGDLVYAAAANGGVFRSDDGGTTWRSLMDGFDVEATNFASASMICGAIAIDLDDSNRIYLGSGEGDTFELFERRVVGALPAYRGVGAVRSDDGGATWVLEQSSPDLAGEAFFALAVDPSNRETVVAGTTNGLYRRVPATGSSFGWQRLLEGVFPSVAVAASGQTTRFFSSLWGQSGEPSGIFYSDDHGQTWRTAGRSFPSVDVGRIALAVQANNPNVLYAFVAAQSSEGVHGLYRLSGVAESWIKVDSLPDVLPLQDGKSQGGYDIAVAIDPFDTNLVYLGGSYQNINPYPGSIWRCGLQSEGSGYKVQEAAPIGSNAHADIHSLIHSPGDPDELWCTCDGGVFLNRDPRKNGTFASQNNGLACLCCNFMGQHPTDPNILFTGLQDNGTAYTASGPTWSNVLGGDGGYCLINWGNPDQVLAYSDGVVWKSVSGGKTQDGWVQRWNMGWATMTQPIVGPPYNAGNSLGSSIVAVVAGQVVYISQDFAESWSPGLTLSGDNAAGLIFAATFASPTLLYLGTTTGWIFKLVQANGDWNIARIDDTVAGPLGVSGLVNDIAVDWQDSTGSSIYVTFGGSGDARHVWWFDGARWQARSGTGENSLLDIEHNAIVVDRKAPSNIYAAADIGVWRSIDRGLNWNPFGNGLPESPVFDIQIHPTQRLLRAALHGRGIYEFSIG
jgi:hypothetical protein